ncbi:MAG: terminase family protein [Fimbriimonadales bacterium]
MKQFLDKLAEAGWVPHKGQLDYLLSPARFRVLACGRRWGKTDAAAAEIARNIAEGKEGKQIAIAPTLAQANIVFERVKVMLAMLGIAFQAVGTPYPTLRIHEDGTKKSRVLHVLDARSGHEAKNLRGEGAMHVLIDEAAFVPETLITEVAMPMLAANDGRMTLISTPRGRSFFYRFFQMGKREENGFWSRTSPSWENPHVSDEYISLQREILSSKAFRTEYGAEFLDSSSAVFGAGAIDAALRRTFTEPERIVVGVDWARYGDYTAAVAVGGDRRNAIISTSNRWNGLRWSEIVAEVAEFCRESRARMVICDATGVGDPVTEQLQDALRDIPVRGFLFNRSSKAEIIENLVWMFERNAITLTADPDLVRELEHFEGTTDEAGNTKYEACAGMNDDLVCALAMACFHLPHAAGLKLLTKDRKERS